MNADMSPAGQVADMPAHMSQDEAASFPIDARRRTPPPSDASDPVVRYGHFLGLRPGAEDVSMRWIAEEALAVKLPPGWTEHTDPEGNVYYFHKETDESSWSHPLEVQYKELVRTERKRMGELNDRAADHFRGAPGGRGGGGGRTGGEQPFSDIVHEQAGTAAQWWNAEVSGRRAKTRRVAKVRGGPRVRIVDRGCPIARASRAVATFLTLIWHVVAAAAAGGLAAIDRRRRGQSWAAGWCERGEQRQ